jgi:polysaccharide deacetylase 2 family uncharacterized protein YibQ
MTKKNIIIGFYTTVVITVSALLLIAVFTDEQPLTPPNDAPEFVIADSDITAIIEEFKGDKLEKIQVSLADLADSLPTQSEPAWSRYAISWHDSKQPKVVIIIDDLGLDVQANAELVSMPGPYTIAYLPYADNLQAQTRAAHNAGHELMVHMPMQSHHASADPGFNALLSDIDYAEFSKRLEWNLNRFDGFVGVNNHMGSKLTENPVLMVRIMARLKRDGLLFVDSLTTPNSVADRAAIATRVPLAKRDVFLDNERKPDYIRAQLASLEKIARMRGYAIAIGHPYPETLTTLREWQKTLKSKGIALVPISQIIHESLETETLNSR